MPDTDKFPLTVRGIGSTRCSTLPKEAGKFVRLSQSAARYAWRCAFLSHPTHLWLVTKRGLIKIALDFQHLETQQQFLRTA